MSRAIDGDKLFEYIQKEKAWKQRTVQRPRYDKGKQDTYYEMLEIIQEQPTMQSESWIPVSERLPTEEECNRFDIRHPNRRKFYCTIKIGDYEPQVRELYFSMFGQWEYGADNYSKYVTAWQPLPEPYKEGENEQQKNSKEEEKNKC